MADPNASDDAKDVEAGRRLFAKPWEFRAAAGTLDRLPAPVGVEVALAGRSNVGKSSLINALTGRNTLARTSHTPGRTQDLIFFGSDGPLTLVDMPGYGYAAVSNSKVKAWTQMIHDYLRGRVNLVRVFVLIDSRHGLKRMDDAVIKTLDEAAVVYQIVLTKADEVKPAELEQRRRDIEARISERPAAFPAVLAISSRTGAGIEGLRAALAKLIHHHRSTA